MRTAVPSLRRSGAGATFAAFLALAWACPSGCRAPADDAGANHDPAVPAPGDALREDSTLAEWVAAAPRERSTLAVALARRAVGGDAPKLELAKTAMEISGCLTRTASDPAMSSWKVGATASMCLTAEQR